MAAAAAAGGFDVKPAAEVGPHQPVLIFEKNENPQNILVVYTKLNEDCRFIADPSEPSLPVFDFYWLMDRTRYKPVHPLIKSGIHDHLRLETPPVLRPAKNDDKKVPVWDSLSARIQILDELKHDLEEPRVTVKAVKREGACTVQALMKLGPSDQNRTIALESIYSESRKVLWPPFRQVVSVTLTGTDVASGEKVKRTYLAK